MDPEKLLLSINSGKGIKDDDLEEIAHILQLIEADEKVAKRVSWDDRYNMILVVGRANAQQYRNLLEGYLDSSYDPLTVALVLEILCVEWGGTDDYLERVLTFALGVSWDEDDDVRLIAVKIIGEFIRRRLREVRRDQVDAAKELPPVLARSIELLLSLFDDTELPPWTLQGIYFALSRAAGRSWDEIPSECAALDLTEESEDIDREMLQGLQQLVSDSSSSGTSIPELSPGTR